MSQPSIFAPSVGETVPADLAPTPGSVQAKASPANAKAVARRASSRKTSATASTPRGRKKSPPTMEGEFSLTPPKPKHPKAAKVTNPCLNASLVPGTLAVPNYEVVLPFVPSIIGLVRYATLNKHRMVYNRDRETGRQSPTFDEDATKKMIARYPSDPVYPLLEADRTITKLSGTYAVGLPVEKDGRVREEYSHGPRTLRLAMQRLQTLPRQGHSELYDKVRAQFVASPGHIFVGRDFSAIEGVMVGYLAGDKQFTRLCKLGVHDFVASHVIGQPADVAWSDDDLRLALKTAKKENRTWTVNGLARPYEVIRTACKRAVFLSLYGGTASRMQQVEPLAFPTKAIAQWYQDFLFKMFPCIPRWHRQVCDEAESCGYITAPSGFRMYSWNVFDYSFSPALKAEGENPWIKTMNHTGKEIIAAGPQHSAAVYSAAAMVAMGDDYPDLAKTMRLSIHDEILCEVPVAQADAVDAALKDCMERPLPFMKLPESWMMGEALAVGTEGKRGFSWDQMK